MDNTPNLPSFKSFGPGQSDDERKKKAAVALAWKIGGGFLLFLLGVTAAAVIPKLLNGDGKNANAAQQQQNVFRSVEDMRQAPHPSMNASGDSLSMIKGGGSLYGSQNAGNAAPAAGGGDAANANGANGQGAADGQANGADNGQAQGMDGQNNGGAPDGSAAGDWRVGLHASGLSQNVGGGQTGGAIGSAGASTNYNGKAGGRIVGVASARHKVVDAGGSSIPKAMARSRSFASGGPKAVAKTGPTGTQVTATAPPPAATAAPAAIASAGNATSGGGAGVTGNANTGGSAPQGGASGGGASSGGSSSGGSTGSNNNNNNNNNTDTGDDCTGRGCDGPTCFVAGTPVLTPDGSRPIESLKAGDDIYAIDLATYELVRRRVVIAHHHPVGKLYKLALSNGRTLMTTAEHRFYDPERREYRPAGDLRPGDKVVELAPAQASIGLALPSAPPARVMPDELRDAAAPSAGRVATIAKEVTVVESAPTGQTAPTFNVTVEGSDLSNYLADGILVHNIKNDPSRSHHSTTGSY